MKQFVLFIGLSLLFILSVDAQPANDTVLSKVESRFIEYMVRKCNFTDSTRKRFMEFLITERRKLAQCQRGKIHTVACHNEFRIKLQEQFGADALKANDLLTTSYRKARPLKPKRSEALPACNDSTGNFY